LILTLLWEIIKKYLLNAEKSCRNARKHPPSVKTFGGIFLFKNRIFCNIFVLIMEGHFSFQEKIYKKFISKKVVKRSKKGIWVRGFLTIFFKKASYFRRFLSVIWKG